ncbi:MAG: hypothetical protein ACMG6E_10580 [Candidatus Roizmanbacteria bacterium]
MLLDYSFMRNDFYTYQDTDKTWWDQDSYTNYEKSMKALTGFIFLVLGLAVLNYGTKLETSVSNSISSYGPSYLQKELHGLDLRILAITILLSLFCFFRAILDTLYGWNIIEINLEETLVSTLLIISTEICPSILITLMIKRKV